MNNYVILSDRPWNEGMADHLNGLGLGNFLQIHDYRELTFENLATIGPQMVFVPHWSRIIPEEIFGQFETVIFHMTDLPYGRGGSPLQNLILRGHRDTKLCALRCVQELDAGPVYLREPLSLDGTAEEIFVRASGIIRSMIVRIIKEAPVPEPQVGEVFRFSRRIPADSRIPAGLEPQQLYDFIRMLDAPGYPPAFIIDGSMRVEFRSAALREDGVTARARVLTDHDDS